MDGEGSRVPVLWDDRGEVAKAFDAVSSPTSAILRAFSSDRVDTQCLRTCLVRVTVAFYTKASSLPSVPRRRSAVWVPVGTYVLLQRLSLRLNLSFLCHGRPHSRLALLWPFCPQGG